MPKQLVSILCLLTLLRAPLAHAAALPDAIQAAINRAGLPNSSIGLVIQPIDRAAPELAFNASAAFNPASVMKLATSLAVLDTLGPAHTFKTEILIDGTLTDGTLTGNLILRGGGDPALNLEHFHTLLGEIRAHGIAHIDGDVIFDGSLFDIEATDPGAFDNEPLKPYNAAPAALLINYNSLPIHLSTRDGSVMAQIDPPTLTLNNALRIGGTAACGDWKDNLSISRFGTSLSLAGDFPSACGDRVLWLNLLSAEDTAASVFLTYWSELGGTISGRARSASTPPDAFPLFEFDSPQLSEIVRDTNKYSNNVMAKMLFLDLGLTRYGAPATWAKSRLAIRAWLAEKGLDAPELVIENGSGLSRVARFSAKSMAGLLVWASKQPLYYELAASLPALGLEGTQRNRMKDTPQAGHAWLKSGSLDGVNNLAGYVLDHKGQRKVLVLFISSANGRQAEIIQKAVLEWAIGGAATP